MPGCLVRTEQISPRPRALHDTEHPDASRQADEQRSTSILVWSGRECGRHASSSERMNEADITLARALCVYLAGKRDSPICCWPASETRQHEMPTARQITEWVPSSGRAMIHEEGGRRLLSSLHGAHEPLVQLCRARLAPHLLDGLVAPGVRRKTHTLVERRGRWWRRIHERLLGSLVAIRRAGGISERRADSLRVCEPRTRYRTRSRTGSRPS